MKTLFAIRVVSLSLLVTGLVACSKLPVLTVLDKNFGEEISIQQNLIIRFAENIVPDSLVGKWLETPYLKISPEVKGKFKWNAPNELVFSPVIGFQPATDYTAEITDKIFLHTTEKFKLTDEHVFKFHTPYLKLRHWDVFWAMNAQQQPELQLRLHFNYPLNVQQVAQSAKVSIDGAQASLKVYTPEAVNATVTLAITDAHQPDNKPITVELEAGLTPQGSQYKAPSITLTNIVPDRSDFRVLQVETDYDGEQSYVYVYTNQAIGMSKDDIKRAIAINPPVTYSVELLDYGFLLTGNFSNPSYTLTISKALKGIFGGTLKTNLEQSIAFGKLQPSIRFSSSNATYLTNKGNKHIGLRIASIDRIIVKIFKIYKNNLLSYLRESGAFHTYDYDEYPENGEYFYGDFENYGDLIFEQTYWVHQLPRNGIDYLLSLDFHDQKPFKGVYVVEVQSTQDQWLRATKMVALSDIGLVAKATHDEVVVLANSIMSAQPIAGADITLISSNNQEIATMKTDANGIAHFTDLQTKAPNFNVSMIFASLGEDFNYLHFKQTQVATARYDVGGMRENPTGLQAFLYGDRDLYRPDETMYLKAIVRDEKWNPARNMPIKLRVLLPNGRELANMKGMLNAQGTYETAIQLPVGTVTGAYTIELLSGNEVLLQSRTINVEEFVPDRIKVNTSVDKNIAKSGEDINFTAQALNLFGPPASNRRYEVEMTLKRKNFSVPHLPGYDFTLSGQTDIYFEHDLKEGYTDSEGKIYATFQLPSYNNIGLLEGRIFSTVFDETGRAVNRQVSFEVLTQPIMIGIKNFSRYVDLRQPIHIPLVAVNHKGEVQSSAKVRVQIVRYEWQNLLERDEYSQYYRYVSRKKEVVEKDETISITERATNYVFVPTTAGEYEIRVAPADSNMAVYAAQAFYAYSLGTATATSFSINREGLVEIQTDKPTYKIGEQAKLLFKAPFKGRMWITVERQKVLEQFFVTTDGRAASLALPIKPEYLPNVYVSATLVKPADDTSIPFTVAHGYCNLSIESQKNRLEVKVVAAQKSRSGTRQEIVVRTNQPQSDVEVTLAVVDEGILLLKNYQSPDPYQFFFQKRALQVNSYNLYPRLFPEIRVLQRSFGADYYNLGKRLNPLANKRVKPVSFWSGTLRTNSNGEARYAITIPEQYSGELRIMAVAVKDNTFGAASASMIVADPIVISPALPRFLSPSDEIEFPVTLTNTTANNAQAQVRISTTGAIEIISQAEQTAMIQANSESRLSFYLKATPQIGESQVKVEVNALGEKFTQTIDIGVRPAVSLLKTSGSGRADNGKTTTIDFKRNFLVSSIDARLVVSRSPVVELGKELNYLLQYPYGCAEQIISIAFPQIYLLGLLPTSKTNASHQSVLNVQQAIRRLQTMQLYSGGIAYWEGSTEENWWASIYALHFLSEAQKAGYEVDAKMFNNLVNHVSNRVKKKSTVEYIYFDAAGNRKRVKIAPREIPYSLYVLAAMGKPELPTMNYYKNHPEMLSLDSRYLLAAAYMHAGDIVSYRKLLPGQFTGERATTALGGSFYSYIRDQAIALNALVETDPQNGQIPALAQQLVRALKQAPYLNTQEAAFSLLGLGKLARKASESTAMATILADGKKIAELTGPPLVLSKKEIAGKSVQIQPQGGSLYYFWEMEGLSQDGIYPQEDSYLKVRRQFYDRNGNLLNGNTFTQGDLIVVKITLQSTSGIEVPNVVVSDVLPAGFEIENPRINALPEMKWIQHPTPPEHTDIRDDRIHLFTTAKVEPSEFYYLVRAVTKGTFLMGPVSADAMYNGAYHSYYGGGTIVVQ